MAVLVCNVCGGELEVNADYSVGVCKYCDSIITIPKQLDKKGNLYNRAIFLRQNNEFDKAVETYEDILKEDNSDVEAHWGLVLSKYGIEYVLDPKTQERIPTCHRTHIQSILSDSDYLAAIQLADIEAKKVIENEARRIHVIQTQILEISQKEQPYDIFICYKESDESGNRTEDSILAQELYYELVKKGYRVFFARKTLESKLGVEYEPIIFAALNSAKVMIVVGTKAEHFNSVWVKNEWSRFIAMSKDKNKTIIPAYRGILPYELPVELSVLQSQDMSKIGFMQDLTDGIERCIRSETSKKFVPKDTAQIYEVSSHERLLQNGATYIKLDNYHAAEEAYTTVTKEYPEDYRGWWGLIICRTKNFTNICQILDKVNVWFKYVKQLADPSDFEELEEQYVEYAKKIAVLDAIDDMKSVNKVIDKHNNEISLIEKKIESLNQASKEREECWHNQREIDQTSINEMEQELSTVKKMRLSKKRALIIGPIIFIIGIIVQSMCEKLNLFAIIGCFAGFCLICAHIGSDGEEQDSFKQLKKREKKAYEGIETGKQLLEEHKAIFEREMESYKTSINVHQQEIVAINEKIDDCKNYISLGKDKIADLWFSKECALFGVEKSFDVHIQECRERVWDVSKKVVEEEVYIVCPACGETLIRKSSEFAASEYFVCGTCGNRIEVKENTV